MSTLQLSQLQLRRPSKLQWLFPKLEKSLKGQTSQEICEVILGHIPSKTLRKSLRKTKEYLERENIRWEVRPVLETEFLEWLPLYRQSMIELGYEILATPEWYPKQLVEHKVVEGIFFYQQDQLVGSGMIQYQEDVEAALAFRISHRIDFGANSHITLGQMMDYLYIQEMASRGVPIISGGRSPNDFNAGLTLGYLEYKTRFFVPFMARISEWVETLPLGKEGVTLAYCTGQEQDLLKLHIFHPVDTEPKLFTAAFSRPDVETVFSPYQPQMLED